MTRPGASTSAPRPPSPRLTSKPARCGSTWRAPTCTFRNYGEGLELPGDDEGTGEQPTGFAQGGEHADAEGAVRKHLARLPHLQHQHLRPVSLRPVRARVRRFVSGKEPLPQFIYIWLPNDHTADPRPDDGYAYRASYVADNDLALGKLVQLFSHSPFWKDMAIFVTEDDAQDGRDHVDAHRSVLLVISPYAKPGVSHVHTSMASILKTINLILGMPFVNQYDAAATDLSDMFINTPDFAAL